ncbi:MAG: endonuclease/exonuclease/phosphatase family protein, partial [Actinomycetota bacterium]|nr:endonuclease/exonuclease/phosphatase family protein [Actinomycetota bacterium]
MTLNLLTFNILQLQFKGSRRRAHLALRAIEQADPDVIVLNEAFNRTARAMVGRLRASGYHASPYLGGFGGGWTGVSGRRRGLRRVIGGGVYVLSRLPIEAQYQHIYRNVQRTTTEVLSNKGVVLVKLRIPDGPLWIAGTHLHADERGSRHAERMAQLAEIRAVVAATVPEGEPVVLAGDLNVEYFDAHGRPGTDRVQADRAVGGHLAPQEKIHEFTFDGTRN